MWSLYFIWVPNDHSVAEGVSYTSSEKFIINPLESIRIHYEPFRADLDTFKVVQKEFWIGLKVRWEGEVWVLVTHGPRIQGS